jgi:hypothetical protein
MTRQKHSETTLFSRRCGECGRYLERTPSGFRACPLGHGKLIREAEDDPQPEGDDERWGRWFGAEGPEPPCAASE